jgi:hypothetical protein
MLFLVFTSVVVFTRPSVVVLFTRPFMVMLTGPSAVAPKTAGTCDKQNNS